jgi:hypothetical protein
LEDLGINGRLIILYRILNKEDGSAWTRFIKFWIGASVRGLLNTIINRRVE